MRMRMRLSERVEVRSEQSYRVDGADARAREHRGGGDRTVGQVDGHRVPALHAVVHEHVRHPVHELLQLPVYARTKRGSANERTED